MPTFYYQHSVFMVRRANQWNCIVLGRRKFIITDQTASGITILCFASSVP